MIEKELNRIADNLERLVAIAEKQLRFDLANTDHVSTDTPPPQNKHLVDPSTNATIDKPQVPDLSNTGNFVNYVISVHAAMERKGQSEVIGDVLKEFNYTNVYDVTPEDRIAIWEKLEQIKGNV